jgi:hypothetical protein
VTSSQISNALIISNLPNTTTTVTFTITGPSGDAGFGNMTFPKAAIPYGANPVVFIDGQEASNQGYTLDTDNFYVWYTIEFSTHQVKIQFIVPTNLQATFGSLLAVSLIVPEIILIYTTIVVKRLRRKPEHT